MLIIRILDLHTFYLKSGDDDSWVPTATPPLHVSVFTVCCHFSGLDFVCGCWVVMSSSLTNKISNPLDFLSLQTLGKPYGLAQNK